MSIKKVKFLRVGGLSSVNQKGYKSDPETYHAPPAKKGIYCFVEGFYESFLLSGSMSKIGKRHSKFEYVKDRKGEKVRLPESPVEKHFKKYPEDKKKVDELCSPITMINEDNYISRSEAEDRLLPKEVMEQERKFYDQWDDKLFNSWSFRDDSGATWFIKPKQLKKFYHYGELWHHLGDNLKPHEIIERKGSWVKTDFENYKKALKKEYAKIKQPWVQHSFQKFQDKEFWVGNWGKDHMEVFIEKVQETKNGKY